MNAGRRIAVIAALVAWLSGITSIPTAAAVGPPHVDDTYLPSPATPAPQQPTEQNGKCRVTAFDAHLNGNATQLNSIDLPKLWALTMGEGQKVAVIDTGVSAHLQLPRLIAGGDYVSTGDGRQDCDGHGTLVAGIIAATPVSGTDPSFAGIAPGVSLMTIRQTSEYFSAVGSPDAGIGNIDTLAMAVRTAADMGATVINISSVACDGARSLRDRALGAAVAYAVDVKDAVVVTAAGNVGGINVCPQQNPPPNPLRPNQPDWDSAKVAVSPGWYDDYVLTVGSATVDGSPSGFSLAGPWVDVAAPGEAVVSLSPTGVGVANAYQLDRPMPISGTSYAAPLVSGVAALVRARFPQLSARQVMQRIEATAHHPAGGWNSYVGSGVVNPLAAISDDPPQQDSVPATHSPTPIHRAETASPPAASSTGRGFAFTGVAGCGAVLAAVFALTGPANRLARRRGVAGFGQGHAARVDRHPVVGD